MALALWANSATALLLCAGSPPRVHADGRLLATRCASPITDEFLLAANCGLISERDAQVFETERQLGLALAGPIPEPFNF